jgi:hypothetical protein
VAGQGETFSGPQFRGVRDAGRCLSITAVTSGPVAGKVLTVLHILEASRVIEDFILAALAVQVFGVVAEVTGPAGGFKGVILVFH